VKTFTTRDENLGHSPGRQATLDVVRPE